MRVPINNTMPAPTFVAVLKATDRCDGCGARAYIKATLHSGSELLFCLHHWGKHSEKLAPMVADLLDESILLTAK